jgi:hypothetical protein
MRRKIMKITNLILLLGCFCGFYISVALGMAAENRGPKAHKKWNIISIVTDDQGGDPPFKKHPYGEILNDLQMRLTRWLVSIDDPVLEMEEIFNKAKKDAKDRWTESVGLGGSN